MKKLFAERTERELSEDQEVVLRDFFHTIGFKVFEIFLKNKFNREYKKLRNTRRRDESYERINGFLDGIDFVINCKDEFH